MHEIKFDGYRLLCHVADGKARLFTRRQLDWTARFPTIAQAAARLPVECAILDGEAVVLEADGTSSFQALQTALSEKTYERMIYYAFDLLYLDGYDLRPAPLTARKELLAQLLPPRKTDARLRSCDHFDGDGPEFLRECCRHGLEGIVSKRRDRAYRAGRGTDWLKAKCQQREEFVIGGFTDPAGVAMASAPVDRLFRSRRTSAVRGTRRYRLFGEATRRATAHVRSLAQRAADVRQSKGARGRSRRALDRAAAGLPGGVHELDPRSRPAASVVSRIARGLAGHERQARCPGAGGTGRGAAVGHGAEIEFCRTAARCEETRHDASATQELIEQEPIGCTAPLGTWRRAAPT